ncbi:MAG TPA: hypothetical protein GX712_05670 [Bacteroidales bacterium]|nr:hypothetical protein [Bacteroidales bacterium]
MKMAIGIIFIIVALLLAYLGITGLQESTTAVNLLGIELRAEDSGAKQVAIIELIGAVIAFIGGIYLLSSKKR